MLMGIDLIEITNEKRELPWSVLQKDDFVRLRTLCSRVVSLSNDVFSYEKEKRHHNPNNIVHLLVTHYDIGQQEALSYSVAIINQYLAEFTSLSASFLEKENSETVVAFVDGLKWWISGNFLWSTGTGRYA